MRPITAKGHYRARNWNEYDKALRQRGDIRLWVDKNSLAAWRANFKTGRRGASRIYSDSAIMVMATLRTVLHLPGRAVEGLVRSLFELMGLDLPVPDHSTLSRRMKSLGVDLAIQRTDGPVHLVIDSSGFKVFGEGEWKVRQHGKSKRRQWMKLHIGVDEASGQILAALSTGTECGDSSAVPELLDQVDNIRQVSADGAYDTEAVYRTIAQHKARATIPPCKTAVLKRGRDPDRYLERNRNLTQIKKTGRSEWKQESGYSRRSHCETAFSRIKGRFGDRLKTRDFDNQLNELLLLARISNIMTALGMPDAQWTRP